MAATIKTDSLQTQFAARDRDLKGADWFNVTEFPQMTFVGTEFVKKDEHTGTITGKLTLHGTIKPVTLNVVLNKVGQNPFDKQKSYAGFSARSTLKRSDFGIKTFLGRSATTSISSSISRPSRSPKESAGTRCPRRRGARQESPVGTDKLVTVSSGAVSFDGGTCRMISACRAAETSP